MLLPAAWKLFKCAGNICAVPWQAAAEAAARSADADAERLSRDLSEALERLVDHKLHMQRSLEAVLAHMRAVHAQVTAFA